MSDRSPLFDAIRKIQSDMEKRPINIFDAHSLTRAIDAAEEAYMFLRSDFDVRGGTVEELHRQNDVLRARIADLEKELSELRVVGAEFDDAGNR